MALKAEGATRDGCWRNRSWLKFLPVGTADPLLLPPAPAAAFAASIALAASATLATSASFAALATFAGVTAAAACRAFASAAFFGLRWAALGCHGYFYHPGAEPENALGTQLAKLPSSVRFSQLVSSHAS